MLINLSFRISPTTLAQTLLLTIVVEPVCEVDHLCLEEDDPGFQILPVPQIPSFILADQSQELAVLLGKILYFFTSRIIGKVLD